MNTIIQTFDCVPPLHQLITFLKRKDFVNEKTTCSVCCMYVVTHWNTVNWKWNAVCLPGQVLFVWAGVPKNQTETVWKIGFRSASKWCGSFVVWEQSRPTTKLFDSKHVILAGFRKLNYWWNFLLVVNCSGSHLIIYLYTVYLFKSFSKNGSRKPLVVLLCGTKKRCVMH